MSVNSKMTALANEVREISGVTGKLGIDAMTSNLGEANDEVVSQSELIAQIASALEGKATGGESSSESVETCNIRLICTTKDVFGYFYLAYRDGEFTPIISYKEYDASALDIILTDVICGSFIHVIGNSGYDFTDVTISGEATVEKFYIVNKYLPHIIIYTPTEANSISTITIVDNE